METAFPGRCAAVALRNSSEGIQIDRERGLAYLSLRPRVNPEEAQNGTDATIRNPAFTHPNAVAATGPRQAPEGESDTRLTQVYENPGAEISAGSVAARWRDEFLIGAVIDPKVLVCKPVQ